MNPYTFTTGYISYNVYVVFSLAYVLNRYILHISCNTIFILDFYRNAFLGFTGKSSFSYWCSNKWNNVLGHHPSIIGCLKFSYYLTALFLKLFSNVIINVYTALNILSFSLSFRLNCMFFAYKYNLAVRILSLIFSYTLWFRIIWRYGFY